MGPKPTLATLLLLAAACSSPAGPGPTSPRITPPPAHPGALVLEAIPDALVLAPLLTPRGELQQLQFYLNLRNDGAAPLDIQRLEITALRRGQAMERQVVERPQLARELRAAPWIVMRDRQTLAAAHRWRDALTRPLNKTVIKAGKSASLARRFALFLDSERLPDQLRLKVTAATDSAELLLPVEAYPQRTALGLPVKGRWWVLAGHRFDETHGQAFVLSQSFAYDLGKLGPDLSTFALGADAQLLASYRAHGQPILAAAGGVVAMVNDGVVENRPAGRRPSWRELLARPHDLAGNFVVIDHGQGEFSAYMHLQPGLKVKVGQRLAAGEELGRCGNSGNSSEPHLHFQLQDAADPLRARGLPARFGDLTLQWARLLLFVPGSQGIPLPINAPVEPGKAEGAVEIQRWLERR